MIELGISNSSPLVSLQRVGRLDILRDAFSEIIVPSLVAEEVGDIPTWVEIVKPARTDLARIFPRRVHEGEAGVLILGFERPSATMILDDLGPRRFARLREMNFIGTVGLVLRAKLEGRVSQAMPILYDLSRANFHISQAVLDKARRIAGE